MKKNYIIICFLLFSKIGLSQVTITPNPFEVNESITITVDINSTSTNCNTINNPSKVYMHSGIGNDSDPWGFNVIGNWGQDDGVGEMTNTSGNNWSITIIPETYFNLTSVQVENAIKMGMVFRNSDGTQELKANGCSDFFFEIGTFQISLSSPIQNSTTILNSGDNLAITATNIGGNATYILKTNGNTLNTQSNTSSYSFTHTNITNNQSYELEVTLASTTIVKQFSALINPGSNIGVMPTNYQDGITYLSDTKAVLVLYATGKDFVYAAGSFNNWQPTTNHAMKKDPTRNNKFWIELTGLTPGQIETYQYWVYDQSPISGSPNEVKTADPYSTLVLSPFDDSYIPAITYPNMPVYPIGQDREVSVLQTGQTAYNWQVTDFQKPAKEDLVIYELLIRDFDANRNFQDVIDRIDYFKDLNINAIELMPVMEFEGNESWGYNTAFHMALDKFYGTEDKFRELVDVCHQNGIAVILDLALNHAFGRNPMVRMWMDDPDNNGWGEPSSENPYFNTVAKHSYSVGSDFDHSSPRTQDYVNRVIKHWIQEFNIDGFRWDLTKGFTQNCTASDQGCTNNYQADRVAVLKQYADYSWSLDPDHYVIFEHLGGTQEQKEWADYRIDEGKGIMLWGKMTSPYNQLTMGYSSNSNLSGMGHNSQNFIGKRLIGYAESHDEERLMYNNLQYGASNGSYDVTTLSTALERMPALGAISLTIPGPKMLWHFGELGMENSIFTCNNGTVNESGGNDGDCKLDTKPQPQWTSNWPSDTTRNEIYTTWSRLNALKINEAVFEGSYSINSGTLTPKIYIWDDSIATTELKNIVIISNFDLSNQNVVPNFPYTGIWYDLMDTSGATSITVSNTTDPISLAPGEFKIFGNMPATSLSTNDLIAENTIEIYPNPAHDYFKLNQPSEQVIVYDLIGKVTQTFKGNYSSESHFDVSNLETGIYLVHIQSERGTTTRKLLKY
ncbi:alpha-amylase family glycosyl hydrolase [Flavobacteriaceae bacterium]|nr:alpha-amylase family glycosyl hydrolase [Flavobacteriaceae bacterium]